MDWRCCCFFFWAALAKYPWSTRASLCGSLSKHYCCSCCLVSFHPLHCVFCNSFFYISEAEKRVESTSLKNNKFTIHWKSLSLEIAKHHTHTRTQHSSVFFLLSKLGTSIKKKRMKKRQFTIKGENGESERVQCTSCRKPNWHWLYYSSADINRARWRLFPLSGHCIILHWTVACCQQRLSRERERGGNCSALERSRCGQSYITKRQQLKPLPSV